MTKHSSPLGAHMRAVRKKANMTLKVVADGCGVTAATLCGRELGDSGFYDQALADMLKVTRASRMDRVIAWQLLFEGQGHPTADAERMALAKVGLGAVA